MLIPILKPLKFTVVGSIATIINFLLFYLCFNFFNLSIDVSYTFGYVSGFLLGFVLNKQWSFGNKNKITKSLAINYTLVYFTSYSLGLFFFDLILENLYFNEEIIELFVIFITATINYFGLNYFVFYENRGHRKKLFLKKEFFPKHEENLMENEGDLQAARNEFIKNRFSNVDFLLRKRYSWMNRELTKEQKIIEVGSGAGFSKLYIKKNIILTDAVKNPWIDKMVDATDMNFNDNSIDVIIASHTIHHFYNPAKFFLECQRVLKPGGKILISEIHTSFFMRALLKIMKQEGYSYEPNVFSEEAVCNDPNDLWSANCAIPVLLFTERNTFNSHFSKLYIQSLSYSEFFLFPLSGGVISKIKVPELSKRTLKVFSFLDKVLVNLSESTFAMGMNIVIVKK